MGLAYRIFGNLYFSMLFTGIGYISIVITSEYDYIFSANRSAFRVCMVKCFTFNVKPMRILAHKGLFRYYVQRFLGFQNSDDHSSG